MLNQKKNLSDYINVKDSTVKHLIIEVKFIMLTYSLSSLIRFLCGAVEADGEGVDNHNCLPTFPSEVKINLQ